jgi:hypothetical protein
MTIVVAILAIPMMPRTGSASYQGIQIDDSAGGYSDFLVDAGKVVWSEFGPSGIHRVGLYDTATKTSQLPLSTTGAGGSVEHLCAKGGLVAWWEKDNAGAGRDLMLYDGTITRNLPPKSGFSGDVGPVLVDSGKVVCYTKSQSGLHSLDMYDTKTGGSWRNLDNVTDASGSIAPGYWMEGGKIAWLRIDKPSPYTYTLKLDTGTGAPPTKVKTLSVDGGYLRVGDFCTDAGKVVFLEHVSGSETLYLYDDVTGNTPIVTEDPGTSVLSWAFDAGQVVWLKKDSSTEANYTLSLKTIGASPPVVLDTALSPAVNPLGPFLLESGKVCWLRQDFSQNPQTYALRLWNGGPESTALEGPTTSSISSTFWLNGGQVAWKSIQSTTQTVRIYNGITTSSLDTGNSLSLQPWCLDSGRLAWSRSVTTGGFALMLSNQSPHTPSNVSPLAGQTTNLMPALSASTYADPESDAHTATRWQVRSATGYYDASPAYDSLEDPANLETVTVPLGKLADGTTYYWRASYKDSFGTWSDYSSETSFMADGSPPTVAITSVPGAVASSPTVSGTVADNYTSIQSVDYRVDEAATWQLATFTRNASDPKAGTFTFATAALAPGPHVVDVRATDAVGNTTKAYARYAFVIDTTVATVSLGDKTSLSTKDKTPKLTGTVNDAATSVSSVQYRVDGGRWQAATYSADTADPHSGTFSFITFLPKGKHSVEVRATDAARNTNAGNFAAISVTVSGGSKGWTIIVVLLVIAAAGAAIYLVWRFRSRAKEALNKRLPKPEK